MSNNKYTRSMAISLVVANMIGTGVFTSLGYQVGPLPSAFVILVLWALGGLIALSGALAYAEVGTMIKGSGGEYNYLTRIYHPALGFVAGWMSLIVGFAAPICAIALAIGGYFSPVVGSADPKLIGAIAILVFAAIHITGVYVGGVAQNVLTFFKIGLIVFFCAAPFFMGDYEPSGVSFAPQAGDWDLIMSSGFAMSLAWIMFAFSGWNASTYIAGALENPKKNLPISLLVGTILVTGLYIMLNAMFMYVGTFEEIGAKPPDFNAVDVGNVVSFKMFGSGVGKIFATLITLALVSSLSAMTIAGPRVTERIGQDYNFFNKLAIRNKNGAPYLAIIIQTVIALSMLFISSFQEIIEYIAVSLTIFSLLVIVGVYVLRVREPDTERPFKTWGYPFTPLIFIAASVWMIVWFVMDKPDIVWMSLLTMAPGLIVYYLVKDSKSESLEEDIEEHTHIDQ